MSKTGTIPSAGNEVSHQDMANAIRALSMDAVQKAKSGHPGMPMGMADVATVLFTQFLKFNSAAPDWPDRDRFVLSAGHGSMLLYALLHLTGYPGMDIGQIANFRQLDSKTAGHPEFGHAAGIETTTGPLGQGIANAVGMAIGERLMNARLGDGICDHYTYVIAGDGCLMEGLSHEAISFAGHLGLSKLIVLFDDNSITIDGSTDLTVSDDQPKRFEASGWDTASVDGHDPEAIAAAIAQARSTDRPSLIACRTIIGYGAPNKQGTASTHGAPLGDDEIAAARAQLNWPHAPFDIPEKILAAWRMAGARGASQYAAWDASASQKLTGQERCRLGDPIDDQARSDLSDAIAALKDEWAVDEPKLATRQSSQKVLERLLPVVPCLVGGSADLTGSNGCITAHSKAITPSDFSGNYIHYGVREHGMAAAMNGIALHGGVVPYSGTFLVFSDYCRPSIRLSALMEQRVIYVMTHDSIGLGEDGPTHQPVEHLASLRAIPNLNVFRPADAIECAECWELAIANSSTPAVMALTRQGLPQVRHGMSDENRSAKGAYVLIEPEYRDATILATGSEVSLAVEAAGTLAVEGIEVAVVSMPSWELFRAQPDEYRSSVLGTAPRIAIEAGVASGWHEWLGESGVYIGMPGFGASAPYLQLYEKFGITSDAIVVAGRAAKAGLS